MRQSFKHPEVFCYAQDKSCEIQRQATDKKKISATSIKVKELASRIHRELSTQGQRTTVGDSSQ